MASESEAIKMFNYYYDQGVRDLCHGVKIRDPVAIKEMADYFLNLEIIRSDSILIPAPQHEGRAIYTKEIAEIVARQTGCVVADVIKSKPRRSRYEQKIIKQETDLGFFLEGTVFGDNLFFLDNVIDTGVTFREANRLLEWKMQPLVYAFVRRDG